MLGPDRQLSPVLQLVISDRLRDSGPLANSVGSGYQRLLVAPGLEYDAGSFKFYADLEVPVYQDVNGNQLVARRQYKLIMAYKF